MQRTEVPLPPDVKQLPTLEAEKWISIEPLPKGNLFLEGPAFDRDGNLYVSSIFEGRILKITPEKEVTTILHMPGLEPNGIAIHKDGRLFVACTGSGKIVSLNPDGTDLTYVNVRYYGRPAFPNDLVFNTRGELFVTDFGGHLGNPAGGVYRFFADFSEVEPLIQGLVMANGIAFAHAGNELWIAETGRAQLLNARLSKDGTRLSSLFGCTVRYRFTGGGNDGVKVDVDGNVYVAIHGQGRILVLTALGIPILNVLAPQRAIGMNLLTSNLAFRPGTDEVYVTASGKGGGSILRFKGLAQGATLFSHGP